MNPSVSIIVPVYNAQKTIAHCIESIINQEFQDFELLQVRSVIPTQHRISVSESFIRTIREYLTAETWHWIWQKENISSSLTVMTGLQQMLRIFSSGQQKTIIVIWSFLISTE